MTYDAALGRIIAFIASLGAVVAGSLLVWIGRTSQELTVTLARTEERLMSVQAQQATNLVSNNDTSRVVRELALRVQRLEDAIEAETRRQRAQQR